MDKIHNGLLRRFHTLCSRIGMADYEKQALVERYGVPSSADIDTHDLLDVCAELARRIEGDTMDKLRKAVMGSIGGYLRKTRQTADAAPIKAIACRVTGYANFNRIPAERLRNLYHLFLNKQKDLDAAEAVPGRVPPERMC